MNREEKAAIVAALHERFAKASLTILALNKGLTVQDATRLRRTVRAAGGEYKVAKHTLARRALAQTRYEKLGPLLSGPHGLVFGYDDPVAVAKALTEFVDEVNRLAIGGGAVEGQVIAAADVKALAALPGIASLRARVVRQALAPGTRAAAIVTGPARRIAAAVAAVVKKLEENQQ